MIPIFPTKANLIFVRKNLQLARTGYDLFDKKRNILVRELMSLIEMAHEVQDQIDDTFTFAYKALQSANISLGKCQAIAETMPVTENDIIIRFRSVMGAEIPVIEDVCGDEIPVHDAFFYTNSTFDEAYIRFRKVRQLSVKLAQVEESIYRLAYEIKKTQKRANALKNIVIPRYEALLISIAEILEEKEREEFTRVKVIKSRSDSNIIE